jgi:hypothetical protein
MGWSNELTPGHEGYLVGLKACEDKRARMDGYRELTPMDDEDTGPVAIVQVGCTCGWRSPRQDGAISASWWGGMMHASDWFLEECRKTWRAHAIATVYADRERAIVKT